MSTLTLEKDLLQWAFNFFTSVKLVDDVIVPTKQKEEYNIKTALPTLKNLLQDSGISRIPFDCKLVHQHYRNPNIHTSLKDRLYVVLKKEEINGVYAEIYLRDSEYGYMVGCEAIYGNINTIPTESNRVSHEESIFRMPEDSKVYKLAIEHLLPKGMDHLTEARIQYEQQNYAFEELLKGLS